MAKQEKTERLGEIKGLIHDFCSRHLNDELEGYALKLAEMLGRKRNLSIGRGRKEIWAASIVYVIARLNFLFDPDNELFLDADTICDFFGTKKTTTGNKATQIEKACDLYMGIEEFCSPHISDIFKVTVTPDGFILPKSMVTGTGIEIEFVDGEEAEEIERAIAERKRQQELAQEEEKKQREARRKEIAEEKRKEKYKDQLKLFDDS